MTQRKHIIQVRMNDTERALLTMLARHQDRDVSETLRELVSDTASRLVERETQRIQNDPFFSPASEASLHMNAEVNRMYEEAAANVAPKTEAAQPAS